MQIGIISDVHGNLAALDAILEVFEEKNIEKIVCLGDMIGYFHQSIEVLDRLMDLDIDAICGNHEAYLLGSLTYAQERAEIYNLEYVKQSISSKALHWLSSLPSSLILSFNNKKISFYHGSPWNPLEDYIYPDYPDFEKFRSMDSDIICLGHTHYPLYKKIGNTIVMNPGSVGLPRNGTEMAHAAIINFESDIEFIQKRYDIEAFRVSALANNVHKTTIQRLLSKK